MVPPVHSLCRGQEFGPDERLGRETEPQRKAEDRWPWFRRMRAGILKADDEERMGARGTGHRCLCTAGRKDLAELPGVRG